MTDESLNSFLKLGYFLDYQSSFRLDLSNVSRTRYSDWSEDDLVEHGSWLLRRIIATRFESGRDVVVPVSGGLDSRAILASLIELMPAEKIRTYTFGTPGTLDYELGNRVCRQAGTRHTPFPLDQHEYSEAELLDVSRRIDYQTVLFHHPPVHELDKRYEGAAIWSGFIGDVFAGSHLPVAPAKGIDEAKVKFMGKNRFVKSIELGNLPDEALYPLIEFSGHGVGQLTLEELLLIENRYGKSIAPHLLIQGHDYVVPFIDQEWVDFMFSLPDEHRHGLKLWHGILHASFPALMRVGVKGNFGLPLTAGPLRRLIRRAAYSGRRRALRLRGRSWNPFLNYMDFNAAIRSRADLRRVIRSNVLGLRERSLLPWIDVEEIWQAHISGRGNHADALLILASLELHMKAGASWSR